MLVNKGNLLNPNDSSPTGSQSVSILGKLRRVGIKKYKRCSLRVELHQKLLYPVSCVNNV